MQNRSARSRVARLRHFSFVSLLLLTAPQATLWGQPYGQPDQGEPGDAMSALRRTEMAPNGGELVTESGITNRLRVIRGNAGAKRVVLWLNADVANTAEPEWLKDVIEEGDALYALEPRGFGATRWTKENPPNYVERSHYLLGRTVDSGRVRDVIATGRYLSAANKGLPVVVAAETNLAVVAAFAAALADDIAGLALSKPPASLMESNAPAILNALRVADVPEVLGCVAPRPMTIFGADAKRFAKVAQIYETAGERRRLTFK
jgi:hypothetical protein